MLRWLAVAATAGLAVGLLSGYSIAAEHARLGHLPCDC